MDRQKHDANVNAQMQKRVNFILISCIEIHIHSCDLMMMDNQY